MNASTAWIRLQSGQLTAEIDPLGAQLSVLRDAAGRDLLWDGDPGFWNGRAPILFPIVGALNGGIYRWGAQTFPLSRHGFARGRRFDVLRQQTGEALFRLPADAATRAVYPFEFELDLHFELRDAELRVTATARNLGADPMPASLGFHPAFRWPLPYGQARSAHSLDFDAEEPSPVRRLDAQGLLLPEPQATPVVGRRLMLDDALFEKDVVIFDRLTSRRLRYGAVGGPNIEIEFPDARYLGLWSKPGAGFICIEPWRGVADPTGFSGDLREKPGMELLAGKRGTLITTMVIRRID